MSKRKDKKVHSEQISNALKDLSHPLTPGKCWAHSSYSVNEDIKGHACIPHTVITITCRNAHVRLLHEVTQSCPILCDSMDCGPPGFSIHGVFQARILAWVAISFSRGSSPPRDRTQVSCIEGRRFTV